MGQCESSAFLGTAVQGINYPSRITHKKIHIHTLILLHSNIVQLEVEKLYFCRIKVSFNFQVFTKKLRMHDFSHKLGIAADLNTLVEHLITSHNDHYWLWNKNSERRSFMSYCWRSICSHVLQR